MEFFDTPLIRALIILNSLSAAFLFFSGVLRYMEYKGDLEEAQNSARLAVASLLSGATLFGCLIAIIGFAVYKALRKSPLKRLLRVFVAIWEFIRLVFTTKPRGKKTDLPMAYDVTRKA